MFQAPHHVNNEDNMFEKSHILLHLFVLGSFSNVGRVNLLMIIRMKSNAKQLSTFITYLRLVIKTNIIVK